MERANRDETIVDTTAKKEIQTEPAPSNYSLRLHKLSLSLPLA